MLLKDLESLLHGTGYELRVSYALGRYRVSLQREGRTGYTVASHSLESAVDMLVEDMKSAMVVSS